MLLAVTGYGAAADRQRAKLAGFVEHFVKPVDLEDIFAVLRRLPLGRMAPSAG
jgi:CheY-like chemotaxis protein